MFDALASDWQVVIRWLQSHAVSVSLILSALSFLATLFRRFLWRRVVISIVVGFAGALFSLYEPEGQVALAGRSLIVGFIFIGSFWWIVGKYENWRARKQSLPRQIGGTFETVADTVRQIIADSRDSGVEAALTSQGNTLTVKKTLPQKKN